MVRGFMENGFVKLEQAFPRDVAEECAQLLWAEIGVDPHDRSSWAKPVYWVSGMAQEPFERAVNTPRLHDAFDALTGAGRWAPRASLGSFPLRFPHSEQPDDAGWHVEGSYRPPGAKSYWLNLYSKDRALLMLFLFTEVDEPDAPTRIRVGSHLDIPPLLRPYGERGVSMFRIADQVEARSAHRPIALATGNPGDVYLCHPFLVHAAQPHHGHKPRFMAQPPLYPAVPLDLARADADLSPVERTIRDAL
ncbi:phytanoyl-CoA dioxygenase [Rugosimonospora africana]|uniref:Phytanoyl-CoA dioxygenase n=1 Tax=Rugosimonospora africana TaxID=556532 RepID=A0A8J3VV26_9ACTN|nr:phytanoyl-CoA dioxygenase [Rugosimonospora africana]